MDNSKNILDIIPFDRTPNDELLALIKQYDPKTKQTVMPLEKLGSGASRDVFLWNGSALKIEKPGNRHYGQNKTEVTGFIQYPEIRKWVPQIWSYSKDYKWSIVEFCEYKNYVAQNSLQKYYLEACTNIKESLKTLGINNKDFFDFVDNKSYVHKYNLKRDIMIYKNLINDQQYSILNKRHPHIKEDVDCVVQKLKIKLMIDKFNISAKVTHARDRSVKRMNQPEREKNSWNILHDWSKYGHPIIIDFVNASITHKKTFSDLHDKNLGISKHAKYPYDIRILDLGIIK
jgi:hypothetical protein